MPKPFKFGETIEDSIKDTPYIPILIVSFVFIMAGCYDLFVTQKTYKKSEFIRFNMESKCY